MANGIDNNLTSEFVRMFHGNHKLIEQGAASGWAVMVSEGIKELAAKLAIADNFAHDDEVMRLLAGNGYVGLPYAGLKTMRNRSGAIRRVFEAADQFLCDLVDEYEEANAIDLDEVAATDAAIRERAK